MINDNEKVLRKGRSNSEILLSLEIKTPNVHASGLPYIKSGCQTSSRRLNEWVCKGSTPSSVSHRSHHTRYTQGTSLLEEAGLKGNVTVKGASSFHWMRELNVSMMTNSPSVISSWSFSSSSSSIIILIRPSKKHLLLNGSILHIGSLGFT